MDKIINYLNSNLDKFSKINNIYKGLCIHFKTNKFNIDNMDIVIYDNIMHSIIFDNKGDIIINKDLGYLKKKYKITNEDDVIRDIVKIIN